MPVPVQQNEAFKSLLQVVKSYVNGGLRVVNLSAKDII